MGKMPDKITYKRNEPAIYLKVNIPHDAWRNGDECARARLYSAALRRGIGDIKGSKLSNADKETLSGLIEAALGTMLTRFDCRT